MRKVKISFTCHLRLDYITLIHFFTQARMYTYLSFVLAGPAVIIFIVVHLVTCSRNFVLKEAGMGGLQSSRVVFLFDITVGSPFAMGNRCYYTE